ncbi:MAG: LysR family transcriptional regulator [Clostridiales Family XIII bacterium]|jgi:DNA-binding transcriptional LysR family regulator|nr:LysR family transcriptional regulator [Clostridiales Family XIII bacterium]
MQLKVFADVAKTLNLTETAKKFFLTQPAISHRIKSLESELGVTLLLRDSHKVSLTGAGLELLEYANSILDLAEMAENRIQNIACGRSGIVRLAVVSSSAFELSECLSLFARTHPLVQADIDFIAGSAQTKALIQNEYDFFFTSKNMLPDESSYAYTVASRYRLHLFVHRSDAPEIDMDDWSTVQRFPFVSVPQSDTMLTDQIATICRNRRCVPRVINYYNRAEAVIVSVNARVGIAILPPSLGLYYPWPDVTALPICGEDAAGVSIIAWNKSVSSAAAQAFKETVLRIFPREDAATGRDAG